MVLVCGLTVMWCLLCCCDMDLFLKDLSRHGKTEEQLLEEAIKENQKKSMEYYLKEQKRAVRRDV